MVLFRGLKAVRIIQMSRFFARDTECLGCSVLTIGVLYVLFAPPLIGTLAFGEHPTWKVFSNRAGWSIHYPCDRTIASCKSCKETTAPDVFVDFFPPKDRDTGWVMVEHLADKPSGTGVDIGLAELKQTANLNPRLKEERFTTHDLPALRVLYRNPSNGGEEMESVYVVSGSLTFAIFGKCLPSNFR